MTRIRYRVRYSRRALSGLIYMVGVLPLAIIALLLAADSIASSGQPPAVGNPDMVSAPTMLGTRRSYYVTRTRYPATDAPTACATGYHFASIWEIADPSSLRYNTELGLGSPDSGMGPPTAIRFFQGLIPVSGWVRTGYGTSGTEPAGTANCLGWSSNYDSDFGTVANLPSNWTGGAQDIGVWNTQVLTCDASKWVWCVQDDSVWRIHLPIVFR